MTRIMPEVEAQEDQGRAGSERQDQQQGETVEESYRRFQSESYRRHQTLWTMGILDNQNNKIWELTHFNIVGYKKGRLGLRDKAGIKAWVVAWWEGGLWLLKEGWAKRNMTMERDNKGKNSLVTVAIEETNPTEFDGGLEHLAKVDSLRNSKARTMTGRAWIGGVFSFLGG